MSEANIRQEAISEERKPEEFQQSEPEAAGEEPATFWTGRELAGFFETAFPMTEQEADAPCEHELKEYRREAPVQRKKD